MISKRSTKNIHLIRFVIVKEGKDYFICKDYNNKKYKLLKSQETKKLQVGSDTTQYVKKVGKSLFNDVIMLLTKKEEYELTSKHSKSLKDMGLTLNDLYEASDI